jgi:hypothetical protein
MHECDIIQGLSPTIIHTLHIIAEEFIIDWALYNCSNANPMIGHFTLFTWFEQQSLCSSFFLELIIWYLIHKLVV